MAEGHRNLLFILTDNQGPDLLSCYGARGFTTPEIDTLAGEGVLFENAFCAQGLCSPTRASILTGLMPSQHGVHCALYDEKFYPDAPKMPADYCAIQEYQTLPLTLKNRGYQTAMIGKWHLGPADEPRVGYEHWVALETGETHDFYDNRVFEDGELRSVVGQHIVDYFGQKAQEYLRRVDTSRPFYLQFNIDAPYCLPDVNYGADPKNPFYEECLRRQYPRFQGIDPSMTGLIRGPYSESYKDYKGFRSDEERQESDWAWECVFMHNDQASLANIAAQNLVVDRAVGGVLDVLRERGLDDDTLVVFSTDQSNPFGQNGLWGHPYQTTPSYIRDCAFRVPLVLRQPGVIPAGVRNAHVVSQCDFFPTVLEYLGFADVVIAATPGRSFAPMLRGEQQADWEDVAYMEHEESRAIRTPSYLYVKRLPGVGGDELYDLAKDPEQNVNVVDQAAYTETRCDLDARLTAFFETYSCAEYDIWKGGRPKMAEYRLPLFRDLFGEEWTIVVESHAPFTEDLSHDV